MNKQKKGISLIVLVITIIVMIILASAIVITLSNTSIITKAREATLKTDAKNFSQELSLALADKKLADTTYVNSEANAATVADMQKYIPDFTDKYYGKLIVQDGNLAYVKGNVTEEEKEMFESIGIVPGNYITVAKASEIKALAEAATIDTSVTSTDVATYVTDIPADYAYLFTIYEGNLYYRYDKATYDERVSLHSAGIPFLIGDANEDGTLTEDDMYIIKDYSASGDVPAYESFFYTCDVDGDTFIDLSDVTAINDVLAGNISKYIDLEKQNPEKIRFIAVYWKSNQAAPGDDVFTANPKEIANYCPMLSLSEARRFSIHGGYTYYRYETLSENERAWAIEHEVLYLLGDGNFDGYLTQEDVDILNDINISNSTVGYTEEQLAVLDMDGNGEITIADKAILNLVINGSDYETVVLDYIAAKAG